MFEQSARTNSPLFLSSWDISKAFDSLSKNVLRFSWIRLGVPASIADFLVSFEELGHTVVRTNHSRETWDKSKYKGFFEATDYFNAERGAGQGDVGSPFNWDAAYNILLQALDSVDQGHFYVLRSSGQLTKSKGIAYADDLLSGMSSLTGLQLIADIISAFAIIFGLDIASSKPRIFLHLPTGNPSDSGNLIIHTTGWVGQQITAWRLKGFSRYWEINMIYPPKTFTQLSTRNHSSGLPNLTIFL